MKKKTEVLLFALIMATLIPLELLCAYLAYETIGEIVSMLYFFAVAINLLFILVAIRYRAVAALGAVALGLAIIPYQLVLGHRLLRVQAEAASIVAYVYEERLQSGEYPSDLSEYVFRDPAMERYVQAYRVDDSQDWDGFFLSYRVGTESTSHSYSPRHGWGYYPD